MGAVLHVVHDGQDLPRRVSQELRSVQADGDGGAQLRRQGCLQQMRQGSGTPGGPRPATLQRRVLHQRRRLLSSRIALRRNEQGQLYIWRLCASLRLFRAVLRWPGPGSQTTETSHVVHRLMIRGAEVAAVARSLAPPKARPLLSSSGLGRGSRRATDRPPRSAPPARRCVPTLGGMPARISACATVRAARVRT